jgi:hypothetical protein
MKNGGFKNEKKLVKALNQQYIYNLNPNLQKLIINSFKSVEGIIQCKLKSGNRKSDIEIQIGQEVHTYSIKVGKGNSIHQESLYEFITFLENQHQLQEPIKSYIQEFIWGDGSNNGLGEIENRISSRQFKKAYPEKITAIQNYFNTIKPSLIQRFLMSGSDNNSHAEYLYYGDVKKGVVCKTRDAIQWLGQHNARGTLHIGKLNFQAWNRNLKGRPKSEHKRGFIQVKWSGLKKDIHKIAQQNNSVTITPYHFQKLFSNNLLAVGASLYHKNENKLFLNQKILNHWGVLKEDFLDYYQQKLDIPIDSLEHVNCQQCLKKIKDYAKSEIIKTIINNKESLNSFVNYYWLALHKSLSEKSIEQLQISSIRENGVAIVVKSV